MGTRSKLLKECLEHLSKYTKEQLLEETEQLLQCLYESKPTDKEGLKSLERLSKYYREGGLHKR